jgi:hypothetical protein
MAEKHEADDARIIALAAEAAIKAMRAHVGDESSFWTETRQKLIGIEENSQELIRVASDRAKEVLETAEQKAKGILASAPLNKQGWHVVKDIPLVFIAAVLFQTAGFVWWMAQLSSNVSSLNAAFAEFKTERYTRDDARRDRELEDQKLAGFVASRNDIRNEIDRRLNSIEGRLDRLEHK